MKEIYNYDENTITHPDIELLDMQDGKWVKCKYCSNSKDSVSYTHLTLPTNREV